MAISEKGIHAGHRERLKKRFSKVGIEGFEPHETLEMLLFYCIGRKDTNELAHALINRFGSLEAVLEADIHELKSVEGIGEHSALLIHLVQQISKFYIAQQSKDKEKFNSLNEIADFIRCRYRLEKKEIFTALFLDSANKLISFDRIAEGTANSVDINITKVMEIALPKNAASVIVAHNHPGGNLTPSTADLRTTNLLSDAFALLKINFLDHLIITNDDFLSLAKDSKYSRYFK